MKKSSVEGAEAKAEESGEPIGSGDAGDEEEEERRWG